MILPSNYDCRRVLDELDGDPGLSEWEQGFIDSNHGRDEFTDTQREVVVRLKRKFEV